MQAKTVQATTSLSSEVWADIYRILDADEPFGNKGENVASQVDFTDLSTVNEQVQGILPVLKKEALPAVDYFFRRVFIKFFGEHGQNDETLVRTYLFERDQILKSSGGKGLSGTVTDEVLRDHVAECDQTMFTTALNGKNARVIAALLHIPRQNYQPISTLPKRHRTLTP